MGTGHVEINQPYVRKRLDEVTKDEVDPIEHDDFALANRLLICDSCDETELIRLEVCSVGDSDASGEVFHLKLFFVDMFVPLQQRITPHVAAYQEPTHRLFTV